jgi:diadenosine tetraphosphatase ApaH/serine/threonine PP2A family protein phosphatase
MPALLRTQNHREPIAFMGGVYGNVPALQACIADANAQGAKLNIFLGDATGCCGHSDEVLDLLRAHADVFIAGNLEVQAAADALSCGCGYESREDEQLSCDAHAYAMQSLREDQKTWVGSWPETGIVDVADTRILLCHGSPDVNNEFLYESQLDDARLLRWLDTHQCQVMACNHTGLPWVRTFADGRIAFNSGVIGKPDHDDDTAIHYAMLTWHGDKPQVEIRRVTYDHLAWAAQLAREGVADVFLEPLRTGRWTVGTASLPPVERTRPLTKATAVA